ncbi:hypothetical protein PR202_gb19481 [Eleusine coracana subsp. coracana]|uniref:Phosphatidylinositol transfer protein N-terminal domain-containing protein n=1 Tax=Eleusine coracana subsp. coracana TaxID=191504 RepID=A0AAV5F8E9_ELECO|nr:hypothetical protein PR202_gb19481 [Eleusine coracana subsp. coracana]
MVQIKEFRIVMPMSMEEYEIGLSYTIMKMEQQNTNSKEGVEVLQQAPFEDAKLGKGQFTSKAYHLQRSVSESSCSTIKSKIICSKIPSWMKGFAPASALTVHEDSWCAFPKSRTGLQLHLDQFKADYVHNLTIEQLSAREVEVIDIASVLRDYWSKDSCRPVMTTYKLVIMDAPIWGLGERLEDCIIAGERALFFACHRMCFAWIDEWYGMTIEQIREMERQTDMLLKQTLKKPGKPGSRHDCKRKTLKDEIAVVGSCT